MARTVRCREIHAEDVSNVVDLLTHGFARDRCYWTRALTRLTDHPTPPELPKYGYVLDVGGTLVGVVLLIATTVYVNGERHNRCNVSSWYVEPAYRSYGSILAMRAIRHPNTTFFNVSPAPHTWSILESQGFEQFATGRTIAIPALTRSPRGVSVEVISSSIISGKDLVQQEVDILEHHESYGCLSCICEFEGERFPFVFGLHLRYGFLPVAHLVYCREFADFIRFAGAIGRFLARRKYAFVIFDSNGPIPRIVGKHFGGRLRYRKGGHQIRLGDVAYSEQVMFGY
jgi:hypothetical protein